MPPKSKKNKKVVIQTEDGNISSDESSKEDINLKGGEKKGDDEEGASEDEMSDNFDYDGDENEDADDGEDDEDDESDKDDKEETKDTVDESKTYGDECIYTFAKNNDEGDNEDFLDSDFSDTEDEKKVETNDGNIVPNNKRLSKPIITKYEIVRIIGDRAKQISQGAKPMVHKFKSHTPKEIAQMELKLKVLPFFIERVLPSGKKERWNINELVNVETDLA